MRRLILGVVVLLSGVVLAQVPPATSGSAFLFNEAASSLAVAQSYTYRMYLDGATTGTIAVATCSGTASPFLCEVPVPAMANGNHSVQFTAVSAGKETAKSSPFAFTYEGDASTPVNVRLKP